MSSHSVVSDVLNALHISYNTKESPRRQDSSRGSFLRRKTSTTSIAESVKSHAGSIASVASIKSIARSLFKHKQQDDMEPITSKKTKGRGRGKKRGSVASINSPQAIEAAKEAAILAETNKFYQSQSPLTVVLREPEALKKLLDGILDTPGGKRTVSRLARTCKVVSEPSLNILWRELYSFIPLIGMFPSPLLRRPKKAGLGLAKMPEDGDWEKVLEYGDKVQRITYDESAGNVSSTIFPIFEEYRPRTYLLPGLAHLTWRAETPVGLERCTQFLSPKLQTLNLEVGTRFPQLNTFLSDMSNKTRLTTFSFISPTTLPDSFTDILHSQTSLEKLTLVAPGALSPGVGRWMAALPHLKSLQLDLTGRSLIAVEGFFDELHPRSGDSTPSDVGTIDSGVFSADELDFSEIRKSALRLTGDLRSKSAFSKLRQLSLTGEAATIAVFLKHLSSHIRHLELAIEDPPDNADWQDLCTVLCERFGPALESLKITATGSSKFADLVRSTARLNGSGNRLSLEFFTFLPALRRLDIDLPESTTFLAADVSRLAAACPSLEELRLCPTATFPPQGGPPKLALEDLAPLLRACNKLYSVSVVINAQGSGSEVLHSRDVSSKSLQRLHVGHSWIKDPLHVAILLSHLAPNADTLRWFHERNRPGYIEVNDLGWQKVADALPLIQDVRNTERQRSVVVVHQRAEPVKPETAEMGVQATVSTASQGVSVRPIAREISIQAVPSYEDMEVDATVEVVSEGVSAQPDMADASVEVSVSTAEVSIDACTETAEASIEAIPPTVSKQVDATVFTLSKAVEALFIRGSEDASAPISPPQPRYAIPSPYDIFLAATSALIYYPLLIPMKIIDMSMSAMHRTQQRGTQNEEFSEKSMASIESPLPHEHLDTPMEIMTVPDLETSSSAIQSSLSNEMDVSLGTKEMTLSSERDVGERTKVASNTVMEEVPFAFWLPLQTTANRNTTRVGLRSQSNTTQPRYIMADNRKQEKDFTPEVNALLPEVDALVKAGKLQDGLDKLFVLEKQARNAADLASTSRLLVTVVEHCCAVKDYASLNTSINTLSKKHGQLKGAVQAMVEKVMGWLDEVKETAGVEKWLELLETLRSVTEGKIYLETPRARVTLMLSHYHESLATASDASPETAKTSLRTASELLSELQVETYSSMERREKTEFILEQMRLLVAVAKQKDAEATQDGKDSLADGEPEWTKVRVGGRKVNEDFLKEKDNEDLKLKYYDLMIQHALHQTSYLDAAKYYQKVWETPSVKEDVSNRGRIALEHISYYIVLAPHNNEQAGMLHGLFTDPALKPLELHYNLVKSFHTHELMRWPGVEALYGSFLRKTPVFSIEKRWEDLHTRVIEHNIRVIAEYYSRITIPRLMALLDLTSQQTEETLSRLVVSGTIWARIDRPAGIINFRAKRTAEDVMNDWSSDMQKLLGLVEKTWMGMNAAQAAQSRAIKS